MSEGARILILESLSHALHREAKIYAEVIGYGARSDAHHMVATHPESKEAYLAMRSALKNANVALEEVDVISAHATSTQVGDISETANKSMFGHMLGAADGVEAIALAMSIEEGIVPPTSCSPSENKYRSV